MPRYFLVEISILLFTLLVCHSGYSQTLPTEATSLMVGSGNCALCHQLLTDETGADVSVDAHWRSTMMANSARDPFFLAKVSTEVERFSALRDVIEDKCATCHFGMAHEQAVVNGESTNIFGEGITNPNHPYHAIGMDGVSCALCHQIQPDGLGEEQTFSGGYVIDRQTEKPNRQIFGPYDDPFAQPMIMGSGYTPVLGEHLSESTICASCHTLFTPTVNEAGEIIGEFPEQMVYFEWLHSAYADGEGDDDKSCQDCHMPEAKGGVKISLVPPHVSPRAPFNQHHFVGGNTTMLKILKANGAELNVTASDAHFDATLERTLNQLKQSSAEVLIDAVGGGDTLQVYLKVLNHTGHKFPAGFPSRRAWIHFKTIDVNGSVIFESGRPLEDGRIEGANSDDEDMNFQSDRNYNTISEPGQVQIYEAIMTDSNNQVTQTLLLANEYEKDNRIPPIGFFSETVPEPVRPDRLTLQRGAPSEGRDFVTYDVDVATYDGPFTVEARLLYQSVSYPFIRDMQSYDTPEANTFLRYYNSLEQNYVVCSTARMEGIVKETLIEDWPQR